MIASAQEFLTLLTSDDSALNSRAAVDFAPEEVWLEIVKSYPHLKKWVIHNKTVPINILAILATDENPEVRWWVATKRKAGAAILEQLANDPDETVRQAVATNQKTPLHILYRLGHDGSRQVAETASERVRSIEELRQSKGQDFSQ